MGEATFVQKEDLENVVEAAQCMGIDIVSSSILCKNDLNPYNPTTNNEQGTKDLYTRTRIQNSAMLNVFNCTICYKGFEKKKYLQKHMIRTHRIYTNNGSQQKQIRNEYHKEISTEEMQGNAEMNFANQNKPLDQKITDFSECKLCEDESLFASNQEVHTCIHKCAVCNKSYDSSRKLLEHKRIHTRQFQCDICEKTFRKSSHLSRHKNSTIHMMNSPFKCDLCGREFTQNSHLKRHQQKHDSEKLQETLSFSTTNKSLFC